MDDILLIASWTNSSFSSGIQTSPSNKSLCNLHLFKLLKSNFSCRKYNLYMSYFPGNSFSPILSLKNSLIEVSTVFKYSFFSYISCWILFISFWRSSLLGIVNLLAPKISQIWMILFAKKFWAPPWTNIVKIFLSLWYDVLVKYRLLNR